MLSKATKVKLIKFKSYFVFSLFFFFFNTWIIIYLNGVTGISKLNIAIL